jgi:ABC-2 type transport system ATP-binding protein
LKFLEPFPRIFVLFTPEVLNIEVVMIEVENLVKRFGPLTAVDGVTFKIQPGEIVGLLGPNGAGKSTTIRVMTTFLAPNSGTVTVDGHDVVERPLEIRRVMGYLPESAPLYEEMKVTDYLNFIVSARMRGGPERASRLEETIDWCGISKVLKKSIGELSKGFRQRVGLAQALVHNPKFLILDEPTSGLDPNQIVEIRKLIKDISRDKTIILSTHILAEVEATCDRVLIMHNGRIAADSKLSDLQEGAADEVSYGVTVEGPSRDDFRKKVGAIPQVRSVEGLDAGSYVINVDGKADLGGEIFDLMVKEGWRLNELRRNRMTLESIFQKLTSDA